MRRYSRITGTGSYLPPRRLTNADLVAELGGSISAEHGLGQLKRDEIARYKSPVEIDLMHSIKHALDPMGLMNPGKVLPGNARMVEAAPRR